MLIRICTVLYFAAAIPITMTAQSEPALVSANIPRHPPLACQARIEGSVKLTFSLKANASEPTDVEVVSGHPMLKSAAVENVKTWHFQNPYAAERKYETIFDYRLPLSGPQKVTFESFHRVEISTCLPSVIQP
jgi:Gram-negative bacterial TonB protein C-terminal